MKPKFASWCIVTLVLGHFSETFSKTDKGNGALSVDLTSVKWIPQSSYSTMTTVESKNWTRFAINRVSSKKGWRVKEAQRDKEQTTNVTIKGNVKKDDKFQSKLSPIGDYIFGSLLLGSCILALLGNGFALTIFRFWQRKLIPMEVFFINLAVVDMGEKFDCIYGRLKAFPLYYTDPVDILLAVASHPMCIISSFVHGWNFGELGCAIYGFCCYFLGLSSVYIITAMAFTRYLITCKPAQGNRITCWTCCQMVAMGYLLAFLMAVMPLLGFENYEVEPFGLSCTLDWIANDKASRIYMVLVTIFCVLLPLIILVFSYSQIIMLVRQSNALMENAGVNKRNTNRSNVQLTWISGLISTGFVIAWCPYTIACLSASYHGEVVLPIWLTPGPALFAKSSIIYNPIIYIFLTPRYRQDIYDLVQYISCKSGVRERERNSNANGVTATNGDGSTTHHGKPNTYANMMEEKTVEFSHSCDPVTKKQTYV